METLEKQFQISNSRPRKHHFVNVWDLTSCPMQARALESETISCVDGYAARMRGNISSLGINIELYSNNQ